MLHILLLILKIIGIILALILGILLLLVCIILFVPVRYEISAKCDGTLDSLKAKIKATWILHLVHADLFLKGDKFKWQVRLAWLKKSNQKNVSAAGETSRKGETDNEKVEETVVEDESINKASEVTEEKCENHSGEIKEDRLEEENDTASETNESIHQEGEKESVVQKVKDIFAKKEKVSEFLKDKRHVNAFKKAKRGVFTLLKRLKPKDINIRLKFGFEDPCTTGQVLGIFGMLYPFLNDTVEIIPDFENKILKGTVYLKGKIRFCHFAGLALKLILCKDIRSSYKDIRNFKL